MKLFKTLIFALLITVPAASFAAPGEPRRDRNDDREIRDLNRRVFQLENTIHSMQRNLSILADRVDILERGTPSYPPIPPREIVNNCLLTDGFNQKTFLASGRSRMDAEYNVKRACEATIHASYCNGTSATLKCDDTASVPFNQSFVCMLNDGFNNKAFRGEGKTPIEAEARAKIACQATIHGSYCAKVQVRCESFIR